MTDLSKLFADLDAAVQARESAEQEESAARSRATGALNRLNAAQKAVDAAMLDLRKKAPRDSDWKREGIRVDVIGEKEPLYLKSA